MTRPATRMAPEAMRAAVGMVTACRSGIAIPAEDVVDGAPVGHVAVALAWLVIAALDRLPAGEAEELLRWAGQAAARAVEREGL